MSTLGSVINLRIALCIFFLVLLCNAKGYSEDGSMQSLSDVPWPKWIVSRAVSDSVKEIGTIDSFPVKFSGTIKVDRREDCVMIKAKYTIGNIMIVSDGYKPQEGDGYVNLGLSGEIDDGRVSFMSQGSYTYLLVRAFVGRDKSGNERFMDMYFINDDSSVSYRPASSHALSLLMTDRHDASQPAK